jgi:hypothetical protein
VVPFVLALATVIVVGVRSSGQRFTRSDVAVAIGAVASWGLVILAAPSVVGSLGG